MTSAVATGEEGRTDPRVLRSRARVIAAAIELVQERGITATTIEAVAERSGVAKTTIYRHWPDQPALVLAAFASTLQEPPDPRSGTLRGDLEALLQGLAAALQTGPASRLMPALIDAAERDAAFAALHRREATHRHQVVLAVIARGIARGELPSGTDPQEVLDLISGPIFYRRWVSTGTLEATFISRLVDLVLSAYRGAERDR